LAADATWSMPPDPALFRGREEIVGFLHDGPMTVRWRHLPARANGQPAVACYAWTDERGVYEAKVLDVLTLDGPRIAAVTSFVSAEIFSSFGLPAELPA
jgi:RNA polymerase sigma-70 factor (ECF subfamily)